MIENSYGHFEITGHALSVERENARVSDPGHGAVASFVGVVRDHAAGRSGVTGIFYEAYPEMAEAKMAEVGVEAVNQHAAGKKMKLSIVHRIGELAVGDASVVIAVGAERRREALDACSFAIDRLKAIVPVWKKEKFADGSVWVGWGGDPPAGVGVQGLASPPGEPERG
jgi:molybdopterin synthase catalytic subunit